MLSPFFPKKHEPSLGQVFYALLPLFPSGTKWVMVGSRLIIGIGTGSIAVLRAYAAMAAVQEDKLTAISYSTAGWVLGLSLGPVIQVRRGIETGLSGK